MTGNADDLLAAARSDLARGWTVRAGTRLRQAAAAGGGEALRDLVLALTQHRIPGAGAREARDLLERADTRLEPDCLMLRAEIRYAGVGGPAAVEAGLEDLAVAAERGMTTAAIELALFWHEHESDSAQAAARAWLARAAPLAPLAEKLLASLPDETPPANGGLRIPPDVVLQHAPAEREILNSEPHIERFRQALDPIECAWLCGTAEPRLAPSLVYDPQTGAARTVEERTGETMCFNPPLPSVYGRHIAARMSGLAGRDFSCAEPLQVLRYHIGQEYKPHYDWLGPAALARDVRCAAGNRTTTALAYLNVPEAGGGTLFPKLDIDVRPALGDVLVFSNVDAAGTPSRDAYHAGEPVGKGEKWLASLWIRARPVALD